MCIASVQDGGVSSRWREDASTAWKREHRMLFGDVLSEMVGMRSSREEVLSLWDWDDTLFPTSHMEQEGWMNVDREELSEEMAAHFMELDQVIAGVMAKAARHGTVVVVTNAGEGWVQLSASRFLPKVTEFLQTNNIRVVSAREKYHKENPNMPYQWKVYAFTEELRDLPAGNIIVMGDSVSDQYAAHRAVAESGVLANALLKFVKFAERPTVNHLLKQLTILDNTFDQIVQHTRSFDVNVVASC